MTLLQIKLLLVKACVYCWIAMNTALLASAQSVCLPAPRLLTTMPMGGQAGSDVTLTIAGDFLEDTQELWFSDPRITAEPVSESGDPALHNRFLVHIPADVPSGVYEARVMTRLGISTSRAFSVGTMPEVTRQQANNSLATAMPLPRNTICNATISNRMIDYYAVQGQQGERWIIDCSANGIDSKAKPVVVLADADGRDLVVERRGEALDFVLPDDGDYIVKIHDLTFDGGPNHFYRLAVQTAEPDAPLTRFASTHSVSSFSWPPANLAAEPIWREPVERSSTEPTPHYAIELPCDVQGSFFPAADVDTFEFEAQQGDVWWVEVASERLGLPTDPAALVQFVDQSGEVEKLTDVVEFNDIPSPMKPSSNAYAYDGPPYDGGSPDIIGKLEIKQSGKHRLHLRDLFGGTRNDPRNSYRMVIRKAAPDFALVAWAFHMELRNGDRAALSKPLALRAGGTMALEVVAVRRDGFDGPIQLEMHNLPDGVSAAGLTIPAGQSRGMMLLTAAADATRGMSSATLLGSASIGDAVIERPCRLASMAWPVPDAWQEIPSPRLLADIPVSVSNSELATLTLKTTNAEPFEVAQGGKLVIPLEIQRRCEFSGASMPMRIWGEGFSQSSAIEIPLTTDVTEVAFDLAKLKTAPGNYTIALYGNAVAKYVQHPNQPEKTTDIVDIIVSEPIEIRVLTGETQ